MFEKNVKSGARVDTDEYNAYNFLKEKGYDHRTVNHGEGVYAKDDIHCNKNESLWSIVRPYLSRFRGVSKQFLHLYVAVASFLYANASALMIVKLGLLFEYGCLAKGDYLRSIFRYRTNPLTAIQKRFVKEQKINERQRAPAKEFNIFKIAA